tara:strand:- start:3926 stop:4522 length:597 start_codon:yes stop_codon:yes gene_type:complete
MNDNDDFLINLYKRAPYLFNKLNPKLFEKIEIEEAAKILENIKDTEKKREIERELMPPPPPRTHRHRPSRTPRRTLSRGKKGKRKKTVRSLRPVALRTKAVLKPSGDSTKLRQFPRRKTKRKASGLSLVSKEFDKSITNQPVIDDTPGIQLIEKYSYAMNPDGTQVQPRIEYTKPVITRQIVKNEKKTRRRKDSKRKI